MPYSACVHVVDDDDAVRDSLAFLLTSSDLVAKTYASGDEFLGALPMDSIGCIVTDIRMPGLSGIDLIRELRRRGMDTPVIVITGHGDVPLAVEAMKLGAFDFLEKPFDDDALVASVKAALRQTHSQRKSGEEKAEIQRRIAALSGRERDVLKGLIAGHANKVIAADLEISPRTVEIYRANIMTKMQANSLSELVKMVVTCGEALD